MTRESASPAPRWPSLFVASTSLFTIGVGLSVLWGWFFAVDLLKSWLPGQVTTRPNSAVCFILLGSALWLRRQKQADNAQSRRRRSIAQVLAGVVFLVGLFTTCEHLFGWNGGVDHWVYRAQPAEDVGAVRLGLMSPISGFNFILLGGALLLLDWTTPRRRRWPAQWLCVVTMVAAMVGLFDFIFPTRMSHTHLSLPSAVTFLLSSMAVVCIRSDQAMSGLLVRQSLGARWLRRAVPATLTVLLVFGWLLSRPLLTPFYLSWAELSMIAVTFGLLLAGLLGWAALLLDRSEGRANAGGTSLLDGFPDVSEIPDSSLVDTGLRRWSSVAITMGVLLAMLGGLDSWQSMRWAAESEDWVTHTHAVRTAIDIVLRDCVDIENGARAFAANGDQTFLEPFTKGRDHLSEDLGTLGSLTADNPVQRSRVEGLRPLVAAHLAGAKDLIAERRRVQAVPARDLFLEGKRRMDRVRDTLADIENEEKRLLAERTKSAEKARRRSVAVNTLSSVAGIALLLLAGLITSREITRSATIRRQLHDLNLNLESRIRQRTEALEESEARLRLFVEHAPAALAMFDREMRYMVSSRRWRADYGLGDRELRGVSHYVIFPEVPQPWKDAHRRGMAGEVVRNDRDRFERADGSVQWIRWEIRPWHEANGNIGGIVIFSEDITASKKAEEDLRDRERRIRALLDSTAEAIMGDDLAGSCTFCNPASLRLLGYAEPSEILGENLHAVMHHSRSDGSPLSPEECPLGRAVRAGDAYHADDVVFWRKDGTSFPVECWSHPLFDGGKLLGSVVTFLDITKRKRDEEALRESRVKLEAALASMADAVFISDTDGKFIDFNEGFAVFHRFKNKSECARTLAEYPAFLEVFLPSGDLAPFEMWAVPRALRGETATDAEYTLRRKDTGETWVGSYSFAPIRDHEGKIAGSVVVGRDITQKKAIELEIRRLNEELEHRVHERTAQLEAANKELEAFTYSVSHDLRAPLRHISGFSKILSEEFSLTLEPEARRYLQRIQEGTHHMGQLVDDLLNLARVGRHELQLQVTGLDSLVRSVIDDLRTEAEGRSVEWKIGELPYVEGDPALLKQVFHNLLSNALKYSRPRPRAVIDIGQALENSQTVIYVRDNGVGFNMKYASKLFGVFQRLHRAEDFEGTGVGLATVQRIVQKHGGRAWAEAVLNEGATFYFTLASVKSGNDAAAAMTGANR